MAVDPSGSWAIYITSREPKRHALYQQQIDEETELRLHSFVTDSKAKALKEAFLELSSNCPVLLTKIESAWQGERHNPPAALDLVKTEVVSFFSTQPAGPEYTPTTRSQPAPASKPPVASTIPLYPHKALPSGRKMGSVTSDNVCRQFKARGTCTYGDKCKYKHDTASASALMLTEVQLDDEEDYAIEMSQQATMAVAEPQIAMAIMHGTSGLDSE